MNVCFVAPFAYGALTGDPNGHIGGVERQTALMARWLVDRGHAVSVCTWSENQSGDELVNGIRIIKICAADAGLPVVRFFHPRWSGLRAAMQRADANIYYQNCAEATTGQVALWAHAHRRRFVFSVASDPECDASMPILGSIRERWLYRKGLMLADGIITQTAQQQDMLKAGFGLASTPLSMPSDVSSTLPLAELTRQRTGPRSVLWVGRMMPVKRPEMILDIAAQLPDITFHVVGGTDQDAAYNDSIMSRATKLSNVIMHGRMSRDDVFSLYRSCHVLACTSEYEGFPNTFLEAFAHGLPVVSTVDPDGIIERESLGNHCTTAQQFIDILQGIGGRTDRLSAQGENAWRYYYGTHHLDAAMPRFEALLTRIAESR